MRDGWRRGQRGPRGGRARRPPGGTFRFQIFIKGSSPEIWSETVFWQVRRSWCGSRVAYFWLPPLGKNLSDSRGEAPCVRGIVPFTHLTREGRMTVTIRRRELLAALGGAAAARA